MTVPTWGLPLPLRATRSTPAKPASVPDSMNENSTRRSTGRPTSRAASRLEPMLCR